MSSRPVPSLSRHELSVPAPYRLDLTVSALRRLPTNVVDVLTTDGQYVRAFDGAHGPVIARVVQTDPEALTVTIEGEAGDRARTLALLRRMLGADRDITQFDRAAARVPWLRRLARRMRGVKPPRYPSLWEAFVNTIAFQQVSLHAASAIARRLIVGFGPSLEREGVPVYVFPSVGQVLGAEDDVLRAAGFSARKVATLRRAGEALASGRLDEAMLEERSSADAAMLLRHIKGIGAWTATVILLRGLGRLDVFPMNDTSVARNLALAGSPEPADVAGILEALRPQQGMLYYHLLLARLEARGELGRASIPDGISRTGGASPSGT
jgi:DNA-3-methyladenine glycosylase II